MNAKIAEDAERNIKNFAPSALNTRRFFKSRAGFSALDSYLNIEKHPAQILLK